MSPWAVEQCGESYSWGLAELGPNEQYRFEGEHHLHIGNKRSLTQNIYSVPFPGNLLFHFSAGTAVYFKKISIPPHTKVHLYRGSVYGAIKHNGQWLGARIVMDLTAKEKKEFNQ